jgi:rhamnulokinase
MMKRFNRVYLGIDLGAESGRVMAGIWNGKTIRLEELHRFSNGPVYVGDTLRWDVLRLCTEIQNGLAIAGRKYGREIVSVGADTWGVDYVLLTRNDELVGQPYHYRDARTNGMMEKTFKRVSRVEIFAQTGLQFMQLNTLFQLMAMNRRNPELLAQADCLLLMPDFIHWLLCGSRVVEFTNATTTQCLHPLKRKWSAAMLKKLGLPTGLFPKIVPPGTKLGVLRPELARRLGLGEIQVVAPPTHDTASAVVGVPTANSGKVNWAYISSGTWSLMGVEVREACLSKRALELNMTNEGGFAGTYRLLKNIMGLWLVQQCKRAFDARGEIHDYQELAEMAVAARPLRSVLDLDDPRFLNPPDMPRAIQDFCRETGQPVPKTKGELVRCTYESLALKYCQVLGHLEELTGERIEVIHIVGGGSQNKVLSQFAADACQRPVVIGPVEATVMGNLLVQVWADGGIKSLSGIRDVVRRSSAVLRYEPGDDADWTAAAERLEKLSGLGRK